MDQHQQIAKPSRMLRALQDEISPDAACAVIALLRSRRTSDDQVNREIDWLATQIESLIDPALFAATCRDLGV